MNTLKLILGLGGCAQPNPATMASATVLQDSHAIWMNSRPDPSVDAAAATNTHLEFPEFDGEALQAQARHWGLSLPVFSPAVWANSRRVARWYFCQHQALLWSACEAQIQKQPANTAVQFTVLVDAGDHLASSAYWDVLQQIRVRYPAATSHAVFLLPHPEQEEGAVKARAGAVLTELNVEGQHTWQVTDLTTQQPYAQSKPVWDSVFLHPMPQYPEISIDFHQLVHHVAALTMPNGTEHSLQAAFKHDFHQRSSKPKETHLPRFANVLQVSLQLNMGRLHLALQQQVHAHLLQALADLEQDPQSEVDVVAQGWALDEMALLLNQAGMEGVAQACEPIVKEWQKRGDFFIQQARPHDGAWDEQMRNLHANFQKVYEKHFRGMGAELYYSLSQSRMEALVAQQMQQVEHAMWSQCMAGSVNVATLSLHFADIHKHYRHLQEQYELEQRRLVAAIDERRKHWQNIMAAWQNANKRDRAKVQQDYHLNFMNQLLVEWFTWQCEYKAVTFALYFIQSLLSEYQHLQSSLQHIAAVWQKAALKQQQTAEQTWAEQQQQWLQQVAVEHSHQYLLQPDKNMLHTLMQAWKGQAATWLVEIMSTWTRRLGNFATFAQLQLWLQEGQWQNLPARIAQDCSRQLVQNHCTPEFLQAAFTERVAKLSPVQWQQLSQHAADTLGRLYHRNIKPLGKVLTEFSRQHEYVTVLYPQSMQQDHAIIGLITDTVKRQQAHVSGLASPCVDRISIVLSSTCYLQEWHGYAAMMAAYRLTMKDDKTLWYWHVDGELASLRVMMAANNVRNRDLIRQQLLLAQACEHLRFEQGQCGLYLENPAEPMVFTASNLTELVEQMPLSAVRQLLLHNRALRDEQGWPTSVNVSKQLDAVLADFRQQILPEGVDVADADWQDAGRYVVWVRAVQQIKQHWLRAPAGVTVAN